MNNKVKSVKFSVFNVAGPLLCMVMVSGLCRAATLTVGSKSATPGETEVSVPLSLVSGPGEEVSGIQCDILFDADVLSLPEVAAGPAAIAAVKELNFENVNEGRVRVIIAGLNRNSVSDGVVAYALFDIADNAAGSEQRVVLEAVLLSSCYGVEVPSEAVSGSITIAGGSQTAPTDVNGDYIVNSVDVQLVINAALRQTIDGEPDVNGDGVVDAVDVQLVINAALQI